MNNRIWFRNPSHTQSVRKNTIFILPLYLTSSFVFEDAEDMCSFAEKKRQEYLQPIQQPK
jgi:hypothetical protein